MVPVIKSAAGLARNKAALLMSFTLPNLCAGMIPFKASIGVYIYSLRSLDYSTAAFVLDLLLRLLISPSLSKPSVPSIGPGTMPTTLTP